MKKDIPYLEALPQIETKQFILRAITLNDLDDYYAFYADEEVMRTFGIPTHQTIDETRAVIELHQDNLRKGIAVRWGIALREDNKIVGDIGFWRFVRERNRAEIGAKLAKVLWSKGVMAEAGAALFDFGFEHLALNSIEGNIDPKNIGAIKLVEKLGYQKEGYNKKHSYCFWREKYTDTVMYTLHASDWQARSQNK